MIINEIIQLLEGFAPVHFQESYDNAGLLTGNSSWECKGVITIFINGFIHHIFSHI